MPDKTMLVNVTHVEESRVAVVQDGVLAEYEIETLNRTHIKGNIHNAVVDAALGSLEAAFVRLGPGLKGFLPLDEVNFKLLPTRGERGKAGRIGQHLTVGQRLMVQVVREPFGDKPPTVSTYFSLPGRYLVLMPGVDSAGVSRKISDGAQRERLKSLAEELQPPEGFGLIVRTAGLGQTKVELQRDMRYLLRLWESIQRASAAAEFPGLVYRERDLVIRTIRDYFTPDIREVWIDSEDTYERALEFVRDVMPNKAKTLRKYSGDRPLFNKFNLEEQIESIYKRRVPLPSGGEILIDGTEALTAIDVNSARASRKGDVEEVCAQTNVEAAAEIARQLRLRDLGGLVVIDFIDMQSPRNKKKVEKAMRDALRGDKARYDVTPISRLGLMEIARQRIKGEKMGATYTACPTCEGYGLIKNVEAAALAALRRLQTRGTRGSRVGRILMRLPEEVAVWILNNKRDALARIEAGRGVQVEIAPVPGMLRHQGEIEVFARERDDAPQVPDLPVPLPAPAPDAEAAGGELAESPNERDAESAAEAPAESTPRKRRRRRRRHARAGVLAAPDETPAEAALPQAGHDAGATTEATVERPEDPPPAVETGAAEAPADEGGGRRRRRRRRKRRSAAGPNPGGEPREEETADRPTDVAVVVPPGVRSHELMPAASPPGRDKSAARPRGKKKSSGGRRRPTGAGRGFPDE